MQAVSVSILIYFSLFIANCCGSADVHVNSTFILDSSNRVRIYHGANFVVKQFPWYPPELLDPNYVAQLSKSGFNVIRLGMMWSGVEPQPQKYNVTYLNTMQKIIALLESNNIFVFLDMHQDVLSNRTGTYDGIPGWLYDRLPPPEHPYPWPLQTAPSYENWFLGYLTEACSHAFQCLYNNTAGATDAMGNFWKLVASTYKQSSNLLGYELINEPWAGNYIADPLLLLPGIAGATNLQPFYDRLAKAIRSVDEDTLIFYEPVTWGVRLNGKYFGSGFTHVPGGNDYRNRSVLSYHYYCTILSIEPVPGNTSIPVFDRVLCDDIEGPALFNSVQIDLEQLGGSAFLTEFGACDDDFPTCDDQINWSLQSADAFLQSWTYWGEFFNDPVKFKSLSRVYARAIAGRPLSMGYIASEKHFYLSYVIDKSIKEPTEIFIPSVQFPKGNYNVTVTEELKWRVDSKNPSVILVEPSDAIMNNQDKNIIGFVSIFPKN
ncbi:unnamed protein product [Rotaria magnacalcarata]|uniref:Endoglycoceramidase n=3 Tax=Rotaria magnacalcarata TaxID=392030 RepID=A0A816YJ29_9BILA|nr:unnamed protein product [Rotaria magnacalcarata]CAF4061096.1 unnamed protein product [Rotaria magnacalcarata]